jgi:hypothetical protein
MRLQREPAVLTIHCTQLYLTVLTASTVLTVRTVLTVLTKVHSLYHYSLYLTVLTLTALQLSRGAHCNGWICIRPGRTAVLQFA